MSRSGKLSLCMIVKNEEDCIEKCLQSVHGEVDEMIIVDTGSTDRTVEICASFGATVLSFPWTGNFADARNYGIERATGDWILWLDADENVEPKDKGKLRDILEEEDIVVGYIRLINYYGDQGESNPDNVFIIGHPRFFKNHIDIKFMNPIHEMLNVLDKYTAEEMRKKSKNLPIDVYHNGYLDTVAEKKNKSKRNIDLLEKEVKKSDHSPWIEYHLGSEYYRLKEHEKSYEYVNKSILGFILLNKKPPSLVYKLKYSLLLASGSTKNAEEGIERAILMYPDYIDLYFFKALIQYTNKKYKAAIETLDECLEIGEVDSLEHLVLRGSGGFQALYYKGLCLEQLGEIEQAKQAYKQCLVESPSCTQAQEELDRLNNPPKKVLKNKNKKKKKKIKK